MIGISLCFYARNMFWKKILLHDVPLNLERFLLNLFLYLFILSIQLKKSIEIFFYMIFIGFIVLWNNGCVWFLILFLFWNFTAWELWFWPGDRVCILLMTQMLKTFNLVTLLGFIALPGRRSFFFLLGFVYTSTVT